MSEELHRPPVELTSSVSTAERCQQGTCSTGFCSPCLIVWGLLGAVLLVKALLEVFR